ncbi:MAG: tRNA pseudouridine(55) synthase TruB, partial [Clostridia bacterium]|nr:tRNA pseudouridine(55) synthase TruB [Clostridia bacterium]
MNGFLCVLKPPGMTSSDVVVRVRRKLGRKEKVGHAGTLDPEASGVLPLMIGKASRLFDYLVD